MIPFRETVTFAGSNRFSLLVCLSPTAFPKNRRWDHKHQVAGINEISEWEHSMWKMGDWMGGL